MRPARNRTIEADLRAVCPGIPFGRNGLFHEPELLYRPELLREEINKNICVLKTPGKRGTHYLQLEWLP